MFVTSFTTAAAFFATGTSAVLPLRVFGIYLGLLVLYNYLLVITWFPVCLLMYEQAYRKYACCRKTIFCCRKRSARVGIGEPIPIIENEDVPNNQEQKEDPAPARIVRSSSPLDPCIEKYFKCLYKTRYCVLIGFVLFVGGLATQIPKLAPPSELPRLLPLDSNIEMLRQVSLKDENAQIVVGKEDAPVFRLRVWSRPKQPRDFTTSEMPSFHLWAGCVPNGKDSANFPYNDPRHSCANNHEGASNKSTY